MRHGKAEEGQDKADYKRKLISKGIKRNQKIGQMLKDRKGKIDSILCSNASRTIETAEFMAILFGFPLTEIQKVKELYLAPAGIMLDFFYSLDNNNSNVLFVGHNPGVSELITAMTGQLVDWLPTSALIAIEIDTDKWEEISGVSSKIAFSLFPKG
jgi:phosphohistidine phosphatase